jgi:MFS family permease
MSATGARTQDTERAGYRWRPTRITSKDARYASFIAFIAWVFSVYDFILFGTLLPEMRGDFGWSEGYAATVSTLVSVGTFFVALLVGPLIDRVGRRMAMITTTAGAAISSGLTGLTPGGFSTPWIVGARSASGLGYSEQAVNSTYHNELYAAEEGHGRRTNRGFLYSLVQGGWPVGVLFAALMSSILLPLVGWRGVFLVATFPAIVIAILGRRLKESPQHEVLVRGRKLIAECRREEAEALGREYDVDFADTGSQQQSYKSLFEPQVRKHTIFLASAFLLNWFGIQVLNVLSTTVLTDGKDISFESSLGVLIVSNAVGFVGYMSFGADRRQDRAAQRDRARLVRGGRLLPADVVRLRGLLAGGDLQLARPVLPHRPVRGAAVLHGRVLPDPLPRVGRLAGQRHGPGGRGPRRGAVQRPAELGPRRHAGRGDRRRDPGPDLWRAHVRRPQHPPGRRRCRARVTAAGAPADEPAVRPAGDRDRRCVGDRRRDRRGVRA